MTDITIGQRIENGAVLSVPPGTEMTFDGHIYTMLPLGQLKRRHSRSLHPAFSMRGRTFTVTKVGTDLPDEDNLTAFLQRMRTTCVGGARSASVPIEPVNRALERLGVNMTTRYPLGAGMWVHCYDNDVCERLANHPRRAGIVVGTGNPNFPGTFSEMLFSDWRAGVQRARFGQDTYSTVFRVLHMDDPETDQYLTPPTEEERQEIARLRGLAWQVGRRAKSENSWCETFENTVSLLGIMEGAVLQVSAEEVTTVADALVVAPAGARVLDSREQMDLPHGSIVAYVPRGGNRDWCWLIRDDNSTFTSHTRWLCGPNTGQWSVEATLVYDATHPMNLIIPSAEVFHALPVGSVLQHEGMTGERYRWTKQAADQWRNGDEYGGATSADAGFMVRNQPSESWRLVEVPMPR